MAGCKLHRFQLRNNTYLSLVFLDYTEVGEFRRVLTLMMGTIDISIDQLRGMIGLQVYHRGTLCQVVEILEDGPALVLQDSQAQATIQADQHGEASRRVPVVYTVPVLNDSQREFSAAFLELEPLEIDPIDD